MQPQPPQPQPPQTPPPSIGLLIGGLIAGMFAGGTGLWFIVILIVALIQNATKAPEMLTFVVMYSVGVGIGVLGIVLRKRSSFLTGFLVGIAIGLMGATAVCSGVLVALGNAH